jgi:hypothetical protein
VYKEVRDITATRCAVTLRATLTAVAPVSEDWEHAYLVQVAFEDFEVDGTGCDFMDALDAVRHVLEPRKILLQVYGASRNVFASGFARSTADGLRALLIAEMGVQPQKIVDTFGSGPEIQPCTMAEQREFIRLYLSSIGN